MCRKIQNKCLTSTFFGLAAVLLLTVGPARALTPVTACGQTLDVPGGKYILTVDLDCSGTLANGINITAGSVFFHLAGHTISSTDCGPSKGVGGIVVSGGISGVRIDGGTVKGFNDGVVLYPSSSRMSGMTVTNACVFGIAVSGQNGLERSNHEKHAKKSQKDVYKLLHATSLSALRLLFRPAACWFLFC